MIPLRRSTETIDTMPAAAVKSTIVAAVMYIPVSGEMAPSVTMLRIQPPPRKLVGGDRHVGEDDRDGAEDARHGVIALLQQVGTVYFAIALTRGAR